MRGCGFAPETLNLRAETVLVKIKLTVEYDGTNYHGWQFQTNCASIQSVLERAIAIFLRTTTRVTAAGRTDAGVHALGQVVSFVTEQKFSAHRIRRALNALTPRDITIKEVEFVPDFFDPRRDALSRVYEYHILNRATESPFYLHRAWRLHERLNVESMRDAISCLPGEHDFTSFRAGDCDAAHPIRRVYQTSLEARGELLVFSIEATAFLRHMVRNIVGTLAEVGRGARSVEAFRQLLEMKDRSKAGDTAPPHGLFLVEVKYLAP